MRLLLATALIAAAALPAAAQDDPPPSSDPTRTERTLRFLGGSAVALLAHEGGHLALDIAFDADPALTRVDFHGIPFFAITPQAPLTPRRSLAISSAGFWVQHATNEWLLTRQPRLREQRAPTAKGIIAFNVLTSAAYAGAAFARTGPLERDTRGMAVAARVDERWVGALVLAPAAFDTVRYFNPDAKWAVWGSRLTKAGMLLLFIR